jgi:propionyl-CoA carboxylase alpha chain
METVLRAERECTVLRVRAKAGDVLAADAIIMDFAMNQTPR